MQIDLSMSDISALTWQLDRTLPVLHAELLHTDDREFRAFMKARYTQLDELRRRLDRLAEQYQLDTVAL